MSNIETWRDKPTSGFFGSWDNFHREFDRMFRDMEQTLAPMRSSEMFTTEGVLKPACDVCETESQYVLAFDLPGVRKEDINIEMSGNQLIIEGERHREEEHNGKFYQVERSYGKFRRVFTLPQETSSDNIEANFTGGVLRIAIPKSQATKARKISIGEKAGGILNKLTGKAKGEDKKDLHH